MPPSAAVTAWRITGGCRTHPRRIQRQETEGLASIQRHLYLADASRPLHRHGHEARLLDFRTHL